MMFTHGRLHDRSNSSIKAFRKWLILRPKWLGACCIIGVPRVCPTRTIPRYLGTPLRNHYGTISMRLHFGTTSITMELSIHLLLWDHICYYNSPGTSTGALRNFGALQTVNRVCVQDLYKIYRSSTKFYSGTRCIGTRIYELYRETLWQKSWWPNRV